MAPRLDFFEALRLVALLLEVVGLDVLARRVLFGEHLAGLDLCAGVQDCWELVAEVPVGRGACEEARHDWTRISSVVDKLRYGESHTHSKTVG